MTQSLNARTYAAALQLCDDLPVGVEQIPHESGGRVLDFGVQAAGSLQAGLELARLCLAGLGSVQLAPATLGPWTCPHVVVQTDSPIPACLLSQYAGWQFQLESFFGMGSGPMRAIAASEDLFEKLGYHESATETVGILETSQLPDDEVFAYVQNKTGVRCEHTILCVAATASQAGNLQVVARSIETALHKLLELGFDVSRVRSAYGLAPLPPVAGDDLTGIGRTNDAILYGGRVTLWVNGDDESLAELGPQVPANSSASCGKPFLELFEEAGRDFYQLDPHLFSPAEVVFQNLDTGVTHRFGTVSPQVIGTSFGWS